MFFLRLFLIFVLLQFRRTRSMSSVSCKTLTTRHCAGGRQLRRQTENTQSEHISVQALPRLPRKRRIWKALGLLGLSHFEQSLPVSSVTLCLASLVSSHVESQPIRIMSATL